MSLTLEYCINVEWLREYGYIPNTIFEEEAAIVFCDTLVREIELRLNSNDLVLNKAQGTRQTFHGWNGAQVPGGRGKLLGAVISWEPISKHDEEVILLAQNIAISSAHSSFTSV